MRRFLKAGMAGFCLGLAAAAGFLTAGELKLDFSYENLPQEKEFIGEMVRTRIAERSASGEMAVGYRIDAALEPEEFEIKSDGTSVTISGGDFRALVFGTGKLLRSLGYTPEAFSVPELSVRQKPNCPFRCCYFARHFHNWYHMAAAEEAQRYVEDLALWGFNIFCTQMLPTINLNYEPGSKAWRECADGFLAYYRAVKRLDMAIFSGTVPNQGWRNMPKEWAAVPNTDPKRGNNGFNVCPAKPGAMDYLLEVVRSTLAEFPDAALDYWSFWPYDEGGCGCENCSPWGGNGFLKNIEAIEPVIEQQQPNVHYVLSTWVYHDDEFPILWKWLESHPEIEYVLSDSHGDFPKYPQEHPLPAGHKLITFPEISMWHRGPWGGYGATPLPEHLTDLWHQARPYVSGCMLYSEGPFEDINKVMESGFYFADAEADDSLREYARYELPGVNPDDFVTLCRNLENIHSILNEPTDVYRETAKAVMSLAIQMDGTIFPEFKNCWRWRQIYCRCLSDYERNVHGTIRTQTYADAIRELYTMYHMDLFPEGCVDEMHGCVCPQIPEGEIQNFPRPEEELKSIILEYK